MPKIPLEQVKKKLETLTVTLYEFMADELVLSWKPIEIVKKKKHYEVTFHNDKKRYMMLSDPPEVETLEIKIKDAPGWACKQCTIHEIEDTWAFVSNSLGQFLIPRSFTDTILSDILKEKVFIFSKFELEERYA